MSVEMAGSLLSYKDKFLEMADKICREEQGVVITDGNPGQKSIRSWRPLQPVEEQIQLEYVDLRKDPLNNLQVEGARFEAKDMSLHVYRIFKPRKPEELEDGYNDWVALEVLDTFTSYFESHDHDYCLELLVRQEEDRIKRAAAKVAMNTSFNGVGSRH